MSDAYAQTPIRAARLAGSILLRSDLAAICGFFSRASPRTTFTRSLGLGTRVWRGNFSLRNGTATPIGATQSRLTTAAP